MATLAACTSTGLVEGLRMKVRSAFFQVQAAVAVGLAAGFFLSPASTLAQQAAVPKTPQTKPSVMSYFGPPQPHTDAPPEPVKRYPGDGTGAYATGKYRDLFAERGHSADESRAKVDAAFQQLFHGDKDTQAIYYEVGANANGPLAYMTDVANHDARTEGMSYGMMIAVQLDKKHEFDAIWNWANTYMLVTDPRNPSLGYFAWSMNVDGTPRSDSAAPDGEEYFVMSLYFAANRWGNGTGIYNYKEQADRILSLIRHHAELSGTRPFRIHPADEPFVRKPRPLPPGAPAPAAPAETSVGPMTEDTYKMIRFVPDVGWGDKITDPSYHLPAFYELWSRWGPEADRAFWAEAADVSRDTFVKVTGPDTALTPDRSHFDNSQIMGVNGTATPFSYDSWRSVSNWSVDYSWWRKDPDEIVLSDRIQKFLFGQGIHTFADRYTLDGKPLSDRHSVGMVATTAVGSHAATKGPTSEAFLDELWNTPVPSGEQRYYDGMLYIMSMMHCSGNFRIWGPKSAKQ
jgi:oligosaccharide reducing-end xylanase